MENISDNKASTCFALNGIWGSGKSFVLDGAIIFTWYWMHEKNKNTIIQHTTGDSYDVIARNHEELKKFVETINMMR